jgi:DNA polymerase I-like protein with 3'-5' exonuclease and polymerase domains
MSQEIILNNIANCIFISKDDEFGILLNAIDNYKKVSIDTETHGEILLNNGLYGAVRVISLAFKDNLGKYQTFVIDIKDINKSLLIKTLSKIESAYGWNVNFDSEVLSIYGININIWFDSMFSDGLLNAGSSGFEFYHGLAFASNKYLNYDLTGKGSVQTSFDKSTPLSDEQIKYAAQDAIVTLLVSEVIESKLIESKLSIANQLEQDARPFINKMMKYGIPFDNAMWDKEVLSEHILGRDHALLEIAKLTKDNSANLFNEENKPDWNPDSDKSTRDAFNTYAAQAVAEYKMKKYGIAKTESDKLKLLTSDKLDKTTLKQIKHPLSVALIKYREHSKVLSTYGDNLTKYLNEDGRIRSQYRQGGIVATGRLSSESPNAQNFAPEMKKYIRPKSRISDDGKEILRCFVYADLSQAELRVLAQVSNEERMRKTFSLGGDFHARTAADMFKIDMDNLKENDPKSYSDNRKKAKSVSFGIPYGLGAPALAQNLTDNSGIQTSADEARKLLKSYSEAYPAVNKWLTDRDQYIKELAKNATGIDWAKSIELFKIYHIAESARKLLKRRLKRNPSNLEISEEVIDNTTLLGENDPSDLEILRKEHIEKIRWALSFDNSVVLNDKGQPWSFESRTLTGRRRLFTIPMDSSTTRGFKGKFEGILTHAMLRICTSDNLAVSEIREKFALLHNLNLPKGINRFKGMDRNIQWQARLSERNSCIKEFEGTKKELKYELINFFVENYITIDKNGKEISGESNVYNYLFPLALEEQIKSYANRYRNHPIQSLVADIGLDYYAKIDKELEKYEFAYPVQAVHDSIAIECDLSDAFEICKIVKTTLENSFSKWCPDVIAKADSDIRLSLSDDDIVSKSDIDKLLS